MILLEQSARKYLTHGKTRGLYAREYYTQGDDMWLDESHRKLNFLSKTTRSGTASLRQLFERCERKNDAIRALFIPEGQLVPLTNRAAGVEISKTRTFRTASFATMMRRAQASLSKNAGKDVTIHGDLALVTGRYPFLSATIFALRRNSFHLVRTNRLEKRQCRFDARI